MAQTLIGRAGDLRDIAARIDAVRRHGSAIAVSAPAGGGVSAVLAAAVEQAREAGLAVVTAQMAGLGGPAGPAELGGPLGLSGPDGPAEHRGPGGPAEHRGPGGPAEPRRPGGPAELSGQLIGLLRATGPTLLVVDDLDQLGADARETIDVLGSRVHHRPVVLITGSHRRPPRGAAWTHLPLSPLSPVDAGLLLADSGVALPRELRERILAEARGNPLALRELPLPWRDVDRPGADVLTRFLPQTVRLRDALLGRPSADEWWWPAARASPQGQEQQTAQGSETRGRHGRTGPDHAGGPSRKALLAAALIEDGDCRQILDVAGPGLTPAVFDPAVRQGLISVVCGRVSFAGDLIRGAIVQSASPAEIRAVHEAAVRTLDDEHRRLWHRAALSTGPDEELARELTQSAPEAERRREPADALRRLLEASRLTPGRAGSALPTVVAGRKAYELGRPDLGEDLLAAAGRTDPGPEIAGLVSVVRAQFAARVTRAGEPAGARCEVARQLLDAGLEDAALDVLAAIGPTAPGDDGPVNTRDQVLGCLLRLPGRHDDLRYLAALAVATPRDARHLVAAARVGERDPEAVRLLAMATMETGDLVRAADLFATAARLLSAARRDGLLTQVQTWRAQATLALGDWDTAAEAAQDAMRCSASTDQPLWHLRARALRASVRALRGDIPAALADCREVDRVTAAGHALGEVPARSRIARATVLLGQGEWEQAYGVLSPLFAPGHDRVVAAGCLDLLAEAALPCRKVPMLAAIVDELTGAGDPSPLLELNLGYVRALLAEGPAAERRFTDALDATPPQWPWLRARIELGLGSWLRRRRRIAESRVHLAAAQRTLELLGATAWAKRAAAELRAAGVSSDDASPGAGLLSPQELHVARLAARGLSNREIGQHLMLSPRTVGSHLYRVFPKLDITSRGQLAAKITDALR